MATIDEIIKAQKAAGKTAIEINKILRDSNMPVPWVEVKRIFLKS